MRWLVFLWLLVLSGCAYLKPVPAPAARPAQVDSAPYTLNGRISINNHGERHSAGLHWTHRGETDEVLLLNPLGQTAVRVYREDGQATLDDGSKHYQDVDVESLMGQVLGWHLPLNGLHHWVLGMADSGSPAQIERDDLGRLSVLHQDGWEVRFLRFAGDNPDALPARLQLNHQDLQVQLLVDEWDWNPK